MQVITWNTTKTLAGYKWRVFTVEHEAQSTELKSGISPTRAKAVRKAKQWCLYHRQIRDKAAA
jgi:hypothetical protein